MENKAQGSNMMLLLLFLIMIVFIMPTFGPVIGYYFGLVLEPLIGFNGKYPVLTLLFAGLIVVTLSSLLTNFFTDWKKVGESQEIQKAFQAEMTKARKEGNTNKINKLMKMQPQIMKRQTEASSGMMKPMVFLIIFIWPIFMWLRGFLGDLSYYYFTVPWSAGVSFFYKPFLMQAWLWLYLIFSMIVGQIIRAGFKYISWSSWWKNVKSKITPSIK
ncbi:MAG: DUF106 domain-containing protein [Thermoplasmatales archaeon]|nr:MAG: DUF106 domain-containing protein [Thermoplasmatales archaeon]